MNGSGLSGCIALFSGAALWALPVLAGEPLKGDDIRALINGRTVTLETPFGGLPLRYQASGVVSGDLSGISAARLFAPRENGKWWIDKDSVCQQWPTWYKGRRTCFRVEKLDGAKIRWLRDDGDVGLATVK